MGTIVVAYDDPRSDTLERAAALAHALGSRLVVTNVVPVAEAMERPQGDAESRRRLDEARDVLGERGVDAEYVGRAGQPAEEILRLARERDADLIVIGTRRKRFFERLVEGSVLQEVLRHATCDVLVVA